MKTLQATCIAGAITFAGMIHQVGAGTPGATVPDAMPEAAVNAVTTYAPALAAAVIVLVVVMPELAVDWGFALSTTATGALVIIARSSISESSAWRRRRWKYCAAVDGTTTRMLSCAVDWRNRSRRALECSGPFPS